MFRLKVSLPLICHPAQGRHKYLVGFDAIQINADPDLTTIVHGVLVLKRPISRQRMQDVIQATLCRQDKFRSNIVRSELFWPYWSEGATGLDGILVSLLITYLKHCLNTLICLAFLCWRRRHV